MADLSRLPLAAETFDCVTCGYVLEHLPDPRTGLAELARVMVPGGKMLLLTTEDNFGGAWTSRVWCCRTYNRQELLRICRESRPDAAERTVVHAGSQTVPRRRNLRGAGEEG